MNSQPYGAASVEMLPDGLVTPQHQDQYHAVVTLGQSPHHTTVSAQHQNEAILQCNSQTTIANQHHDLTAAHCHSPHQSSVAGPHHNSTTMHSCSPNQTVQPQHHETTTLHQQTVHNNHSRQHHTAPVIHSQNTQQAPTLNQHAPSHSPQEIPVGHQHISHNMISHGQSPHHTILNHQRESISKSGHTTSSSSQREIEERENVERSEEDITITQSDDKSNHEQSDEEIKIEDEEVEAGEDEEVEAGGQEYLPKKRARRGRLKGKKKSRSKRATSVETQVETSLTAFMRKRRQDLTLGAKVKVLEMLDMEPKVPQGKIANMFRVSQSQVSRIMKNKDAIMGQWNRFATPDRKRCRLGKAGALEQKLVDWYKQAKKEDLPISGPILMEKAKSIGNEMGIDFKPSAGWLGRWKDRNGVTLKRFKEKDGAPSITKVGNHWRRYMFAKATKEVPLQNVWVVDETVLVYNSVPDYICQGNSVENDKMSVILASNLAGTERRSTTIVGQVQSLGSATLPCQYHYHPNAAITLEFFSSWLREWDRELRSKKKKIVVLLNKAAHHPENILHLFNINLTFFPQGTAAVLQPFRLGIISIFKSLYRHQQLKNILSKVQANEHMTHGSTWTHSILSPPTLSHGTSPLDAVFMIHKAWRHVSPETIVKGVVKAGLSKDVDALNVNDQVCPPPGVYQQEFDTFVNSDVDLIPADPEDSQEAKGASGMGTNVQYPHYSNMFTNVNSKIQQSNQQVNTSEEQISPSPKVSEVIIACQILRRYVQQQGGRLFDEFSVLESAIQTDMMLDSRPDLRNDLPPDPVHDPGSVHSLEAHQHALEQKLDYIQKMQDELHQQKLQKEMKKSNQIAISQTSHTAVAAPVQDLQNDLHNQLIEANKHDLHSQDLVTRQEMVRHELHPQPQMQRTEFVRQDLIRPEYRHELHPDNNRPRTSLVELRTVNTATFRTTVQSDGRSERGIALKNDAMSAISGDARNLPGMADHRANVSELHHPGHAPDLTQTLRHDTRMENPSMPYYTVPNTLHHYMQPK